MKHAILVVLDSLAVIFFSMFFSSVLMLASILLEIEFKDYIGFLSMASIVCGGLSLLATVAGFWVRSIE